MASTTQNREDSGIKSYGVWSLGRYRNLRGTLSSSERHFKVDLELGNRITLDRTATTVRGLLDADDTHILLRDCHITHESTKYGSNKVRSRMGVESYIKLEHTSPIKKLGFSSLEVNLPGKMHYKRDLLNQYLNTGISSSTKIERDIALYETKRYKVHIHNYTLVRQSDDTLITKLRPKLVLSYEKPQNLKMITKDFNKIRNLIAICSYFSQSINIIDVDLFYSSKLEDRREVPVKFNSKGSRLIQSGERDDDTPSWWLFSMFLKRPQEIFTKYFELIDNEEFQYVIDVYLGHFRPSKNPGVAIEFQFLAAIQLLEATYERLVEDIDTEVKRKKEAYSCSCGNNYCKKCTRLQLRDLTAKLRELVKKSIGDNDKYKGFSLPYDDIAYTRNYHTHGKKNSHRDLMSVHEMHVTIIKLEFIFLYTLFKELGYSNEDLDKALPHLSPFSWVI